MPRKAQTAARTGKQGRRSGGRPRVGSLAARLSDVPHLDTDALLADPDVRIVVCCGSGGVGKTTTSAALGLRAAEQGRKSSAPMIDPARRLAQSMGLSELDNIPRAVVGMDDSRGGVLMP